MLSSALRSQIVTLLYPPALTTLPSALDNTRHAYVPPRSFDSHSCFISRNGAS